MSNLIPQLAKKKVTTEYWVRVLTAWCGLWSISLLVAAVLIYPVYVFTATQVNVQSASASSAESVVADFDEVATQIETANNQARLVIEDSRKTRASQYISFLDSFENSEITIRSINLMKTKDGSMGPISLTGVAADRTSLAGLRDELLEEPAVEVVDLPIANLARDRDINFNLTITMDSDVSL